MFCTNPLPKIQKINSKHWKSCISSSRFWLALSMPIWYCSVTTSTINTFALMKAMINSSHGWGDITHGTGSLWLVLCGSTVCILLLVSWATVIFLQIPSSAWIGRSLPVSILLERSQSFEHFWNCNYLSRDYFL